MKLFATLVCFIFSVKKENSFIIEHAKVYSFIFEMVMNQEQ